MNKLSSPLSGKKRAKLCKVFRPCNILVMMKKEVGKFFFGNHLQSVIPEGDFWYYP